MLSASTERTFTFHSASTFTIWW